MTNASADTPNIPILDNKILILFGELKGLTIICQMI
jgi:hypothetical protein